MNRLTIVFTKQIVLRLGIATLAGVSLGQSAQTPLPTDPGMYVQAAGGLTKIIGQIAEFKRSGSALVSHATIGIKSKKENIQLLGPHAQTVVSPQPVFYFIPAKQEADAGVNAGDLILIRLEEKPERRQFEIAASGAWRSSSGISLTHQIQLLRSEVTSSVYKVAPASALSKGEYALYLSRGEGMAPYVYDFSVQEISVATAKEPVAREPVAKEVPLDHRNSQLSEAGFSAHKDQAAPAVTAPVHVFKDASIGVFCDGNPDIRHDGVTLTALTPGGPADQAGIKAGDVILAINDHYLFTIRELQEEISHQQPGTKIAVRYRRYSTIYDASLVVGQVQ
jgi:membrane-associated protease RseP (regulator of RpoE activity)